MNYWTKLDESLILDPSIRIIQAPFEEFNALSKFIEFSVLEVFDQICHIFNTNLSHAPNFVIIEIFKGIENFVNKHIVVKMLTDCNECWQQKLFNFEQHAFSYIT